MLAITAKARLLKEEVSSAINVCNSILTSLSKLNDDSDYRKEIGIYAIQAPDWKILVDERKKFIDIIRQICTGEISTKDAHSLISQAILELSKLDAWLQVPSK